MCILASLLINGKAILYTNPTLFVKGRWSWLTKANQVSGNLVAAEQAANTIRKKQFALQERN